MPKKSSKKNTTRRPGNEKEKVSTRVIKLSVFAVDILIKHFPENKIRDYHEIADILWENSWVKNEYEKKENLNKSCQNLLFKNNESLLDLGLIEKQGEKKFCFIDPTEAMNQDASRYALLTILDDVLRHEVKTNNGISITKANNNNNMEDNSSSSEAIKQAIINICDSYEITCESVFKERYFAPLAQFLKENPSIEHNLNNNSNSSPLISVDLEQTDTHVDSSAQQECTRELSKIKNMLTVLIIDILIKRKSESPLRMSHILDRFIRDESWGELAYKKDQRLIFPCKRCLFKNPRSLLKIGLVEQEGECFSMIDSLKEKEDSLLEILNNAINIGQSAYASQYVKFAVIDICNHYEITEKSRIRFAPLLRFLQQNSVTSGSNLAQSNISSKRRVGYMSLPSPVTSERKKMKRYMLTVLVLDAFTQLQTEKSVKQIAEWIDAVLWQEQWTKKEYKNWKCLRQACERIIYEKNYSLLNNSLVKQRDKYFSLIDFNDIKNDNEKKTYLGKILDRTQKYNIEDGNETENTSNEETGTYFSPLVNTALINVRQWYQFTSESSEQTLTQTPIISAQNNTDAAPPVLEKDNEVEVEQSSNEEHSVPMDCEPTEERVSSPQNKRDLELSEDENNSPYEFMKAKRLLFILANDDEKDRLAEYAKEKNELTYNIPVFKFIPSEEYDKYLVVAATPGLGKGQLGVFVVKDYEKDEVIAPYKGISKWGTLSIKEMKTKIKNYTGSGDFLLQTYTDDKKSEAIDMLKQGSVVRFVNHSDFPNAEARVVNGEILCITKRKIVNGEEVTVSYGDKYFDPDHPKIMWDNPSSLPMILSKMYELTGLGNKSPEDFNTIELIAAAHARDDWNIDRAIKPIATQNGNDSKDIIPSPKRRKTALEENSFFAASNQQTSASISGSQTVGPPSFTQSVRTTRRPSSIFFPLSSPGQESINTATIDHLEGSSSPSPVSGSGG